MIRTIVKREFLDNILSFKFMACVLVAIVVSLASTSILMRDYQDRLRNYDKGVASAKEALTKVPVYSCLKIKLYRKPSPMSIFVAGIERKTGYYGEIPLLGMDIPTSLQGGVTKNEFATVFSIFDFSSIIIIIFTVLAILLSYGTISGERETGLLSLALSNSVPRSRILLGKYLGGLVSVAVPLALCFILGALYLLISKNVEADTNSFASMGLLYCVSLLYLSCILLLGIFASSITKTSFGSLLFLLTFYLVFTFLIPQAVKSYSNDAINGRARNVANNIKSLQSEWDKKYSEYYRNAAFKKTWAGFRDAANMKIYGGIILSRISTLEYIEDLNQMLSMQVARDHAQEIYDLKIRDMAVDENIRRRQNRLLAFIPSASFGHIVELVADTGNESLERYLQQVNLYWHQYMGYLDQKNAFGPRFIYPGPDELTPYEKGLIKKITEDVPGQISVKDASWLSYYSGKYRDEALRYRPELTFLNLDDLPEFKAPEPELADRLKSSLFNIEIVFFYNVLFFVLAYFSFANYDPRRSV
jgi:ABC-type transport system involved in multi-copper enzyme maturation permease subunit